MMTDEQEKEFVELLRKRAGEAFEAWRQVNPTELGIVLNSVWGAEQRKAMESLAVGDAELADKLDRAWFLSFGFVWGMIHSGAVKSTVDEKAKMLAELCVARL